MPEVTKIKPTNIDKYKKWLFEEHEVEIDSRYINYYNSVVSKIQNDFSKSDIWQHINSNLQLFNQEYVVSNGYYLFIDDKIPELQTKEFSSFLLKTFRKNIINNGNWPNSPLDGWVLPSNWFRQINDLVRTLFVVKYIDGVSFLTDKFKAICTDFKCECCIDFEAKEEGYYAAHSYIDFISNIPNEKWDTTNIQVQIELQTTTQLQEIIRKLLHEYYEEDRKRIIQKALKWQWDYKSDEFAANYLGHILHYIEGMIIEIRDKQKDK